MTNNKVIVEEMIKNMEESVMNIAKLKRKVSNKISNNNLILILKHLEQEGKIFIGSKGIAWIHSSPKHLKVMLKDCLEI